MTRTHSYRPGAHQSRREIDMAIGVLMGIRRCSAREASEALAGVTRASGIGLGGVSRTLLDMVSGDVEPNTTDDATAHWKALLALLPRRGD